MRSERWNAISWLCRWRYAQDPDEFRCILGEKDEGELVWPFDGTP